MSFRTPAPSVTPRPRSGRLALAGLLIGLAALTTLAVAGLGYRLGWWPLGTAFTLARVSAYGAILAFALSAAGLVLALRRRGARGIALGLLGLAVALTVLVPAVQWRYAASVSPSINDITTDLEDPPLFRAMPRPGAYPGGDTAAQQRAAYPDLQPLALNLAPERVFALARALVDDRGWTIVAVEPAEARIEAVATTLLYGFEDEVAIRIAPAEFGTIVDLRSRSRIGRGDLGTNAARIRSFLTDLEQLVEEEAP